LLLLFVKNVFAATFEQQQDISRLTSWRCSVVRQFLQPRLPVTRHAARDNLDSMAFPCSSMRLLL